ncbi:MAG: hypothetical protein QOD06_2285, partial [Candidatus Binatota bacterium]|nr:hypothetical protein [Candidatus Binatota bacterium]
GPNPLTGLFPAPGVFVPPPAPMTTPRWAHTASLTPADPAGTAVLIAGAATGGPTTATEAYLP